MDQSDWPAADGSSGITSSKAMDDAENAHRAIEVGSNFFLFFSSHLSSAMAHAGHALPLGDNSQPKIAGTATNQAVPYGLKKAPPNHSAHSMN